VKVPAAENEAQKTTTLTIAPRWAHHFGFLLLQRCQRHFYAALALQRFRLHAGAL
jgi:hypothetical protein